MGICSKFARERVFIGHLSNKNITQVADKNIGHLSNPIISQMADAGGVFLLYTFQRLSRDRGLENLIEMIPKERALVQSLATATTVAVTRSFAVLYHIFLGVFSLLFDHSTITWESISLLRGRHMPASRHIS